jgi:hypothetical protein
MHTIPTANRFQHLHDRRLVWAPQIQRLALAWTPHWQDEKGVLTQSWQ